MLTTSARGWRQNLNNRILFHLVRSRDWDRLAELETNPDYSLDPYSSWLTHLEALRPSQCPWDAEPHKHLRSLSPPKYRTPLKFLTAEESEFINWVGAVIMCVEMCVGMCVEMPEEMCVGMRVRVIAGTAVTAAVVRGVVTNLKEMGLKEAAFEVEESAEVRVAGVGVVWEFEGRSRIV